MRVLEWVFRTASSESHLVVAGLLSTKLLSLIRKIAQLVCRVSLGTQLLSRRPLSLLGYYTSNDPKGELLVSAAYWTTGFRVLGLRIQGLAYRVSSLQDSVFNSVFKVGCLDEA